MPICGARWTSNLEKNGKKSTEQKLQVQGIQRDDSQNDTLQRSHPAENGGEEGKKIKKKKKSKKKKKKKQN
jgi:hypothetical protein